ncbi:MAG: hypothetical protein ACRD29_24535, partial [Acidimicrobiales bacterium]
MSETGSPPPQPPPDDQPSDRSAERSAVDRRPGDVSLPAPDPWAYYTSWATGAVARAKPHPAPDGRQVEPPRIPEGPPSPPLQAVQAVGPPIPPDEPAHRPDPLTGHGVAAAGVPPEPPAADPTAPLPPPPGPGASL